MGVVLSIYNNNARVPMGGSGLGFYYDAANLLLLIEKSARFAANCSLSNDKKRFGATGYSYMPGCFFWNFASTKAATATVLLSSFTQFEPEKRGLSSSCFVAGLSPSCH